MIAIFHSLSVSGTAMDGYPNIVLIMSDHTFFFNKKISSSSSVSVFMANASNLIMKSTMFCFPCLKVLIFYSASAAFVLSLNVILISLTKLSQSCVPSSVKIIDGGLYFIFSFHFYFLFLFNFLFLEQLGLGVISHAVTSVTA